MKHTKHWLVFCIAALVPTAHSLAWPQGSHLNFNIQSQITNLDSIESRIIKLNNPIFSFDWLPITDWETSRNANKAVSAQFVYRTVPSLTLQFIVYRKGAWLSDLKDESVSQYIDSLPAQFPDCTIEITNEGQYKPPVGSVPFLENTFRQIFYTVTPKKAQTPPFTVHDFWTITDDSVMVIARYEGEDSIVIDMNSSFERELAQFLLREE